MARNAVARAEMVKSIRGLVTSQGGTIRSGADILPSLASNYASTATGVGLPRNPQDTVGSFTPGQPAFPYPIDALGPNGRPQPRKSQYKPGYNLPTAPGQGKLVPFMLLRNLADIYDVARRCIEIRKQEISSIDWDIIPRTDADVARGKKQLYKANLAPGQGKHDVDRKEIRKWFTEPDRIAGYSLGDWMKCALEEILVVDALSVYEHPTLGPRGGPMGGDLYALEILDGTTIKPLVDHRGGRPQPPYPAYQQFLYGIPRTDMVATLLDAYDDPEIQAMQRGFDPESSVNPEMVKMLRADQLAYRPYVPRTWTMYGLSAIEQIVMNINIALSRQQWHRAYFNEGDVPAMLIHVPDTWNLDQINKYELQWHAMLAGDQGWKHRVKAVPGVEKAEVLKPPFHQMDFDEFILKITCMGMDVDPIEVGFGDKQQSSSQSSVQALTDRKYRTSLRPILKWFQEYFDSIIRRRFGNDDLVFRFEGLEIEDEKLETEIDLMKLKAGAMSINQLNAKRGIEPMNIPQAEKPNVYLTRDVVPLDAVGVLTESPDQLAVGQDQPGGRPILPAGNAARPSSNGAGGVARSNASPTRPTPARKSPAQPNSKPSTAQKVSEAIGELRAFEKFMLAGRTRRFQPEYLPISLVDATYERVAQGEAVKSIFADLKYKQAYASDAIVSEIVDGLI